MASPFGAGRGWGRGRWPPGREQTIGTSNIRRLREQQPPFISCTAEQSRQSLSHRARFSRAQESRIESRDEVHAAWLPTQKRPATLKNVTGRRLQKGDHPMNSPSVTFPANL